VRLLIDENLSPTLTTIAHDHGYDAIAVRDRNALRKSDSALLALCIEEERVMVTANAGDFRALCVTTEVHPGLVVLPAAMRAAQQENLAAALLTFAAVPLRLARSKAASCSTASSRSTRQARASTPRFRRVERSQSSMPNGVGALPSSGGWRARYWPSAARWSSSSVMSAKRPTR
jgi:predicted nuclease of predicted toxin-antitoxin system